MKTCIKNRFLLPVVTVSLGLMAGHLTAQTFTTLHSFTTVNWCTGFGWTNSDGATPDAGLVLSGNTLYGTTSKGGDIGNGSLFALNTDGTGFTNLHSFMTPAVNYSFTNSDGAYPEGELLLNGNTLYGTATGGGASGYGTLFAVNTNGTDLTAFYSFTALDLNTGTNGDGANPIRGLVLANNTLYGAASDGGSLGGGTLFRINTDGSDFTNLHSFSSGTYGGEKQRCGLILSGNTLFGTTECGGDTGYGSVFALNTDGTGFTNLHSFPKTYHNYTNTDGACPIAALALSGNILYGTTESGGTWGWGTIFRVNVDGTGFTNLHDFTALSDHTYSGTNSDGTSTAGALILWGNTLYGTAYNGGSSGNGTVFGVNTDGTGFTNLHNFTKTVSGTNSDGAYPYAGLILSGNTLYGTTSEGGNSGQGTVFSVLLSVPSLTIVPSAADVVLTWPTNATGLTLQSTTNLASPIWTTNSPAPVVVNGQNIVTNPISGTQQFFRLQASP